LKNNIFEPRITFTSKEHNLWKQKNTSTKRHLETTAAYEKTIFTKFTNQGAKWSISKN
jgi:hypothetical protein